MGFSTYRGHDTANDDLMAQGVDPRTRRGYVGGGTAFVDSDGNDASIRTEQNTPGGTRWDPANQGEEVVNGYRQGGTNPYDKDVTAYRQTGEAAQGRGAVTLDQRQADESRGLQMGGLGLMGGAARGNAPSRAAILGKSATDSVTRSSLAGLAGGHGQGGAINAANAAGANQTATMTRNNAAVGDLRAAEMAKNRTEFAGAANQTRIQDNSAATQNAKFEAQQRALNEAKQQGYENLGFDVRRTQQQAAVDYETEKRREALQAEADRRARDDADTKRTWDNGSAGVGIIMGSTPSDERLKSNIRPVTLGSLSGLTRFMHGR